MSNVERVRGGRRERFEDLIAWQKARELAKRIYTLICAGRFARDFGLSSQLQRSAVSIMSNLAGVFERGSTAEFHGFLTITKASCAEVRSQLYLASDIGYLPEPEFSQVMKLADEVAKILGASRLPLRTERLGKCFYSLLIAHYALLPEAPDETYPRYR